MKLSPNTLRKKVHTIRSTCFSLGLILLIAAKPINGGSSYWYYISRWIFFREIFNGIILMCFFKQPYFSHELKSKARGNSTGKSQRHHLSWWSLVFQHGISNKHKEVTALSNLSSFLIKARHCLEKHCIGGSDEQ